ncbi:MAG: cell division protein FtsQ/DivIB [Halothiobacillaceae bacterium]
MSAMAARRRPPWWRMLPGLAARAAWPLLLLTVMGVIAFQARAYWQALSAPGAWPVREVSVEGSLQYADAQRLRAVLAEQLRPGFLAADLYTLKREILADAWIAEARLERQWPDRVRVTLREHRPLARWRGDGVLDARGGVFRPELETIPDGLPVLVGSEGRQWPLWERYQVLAGVLDGVDLALVGVREDARGSLDLMLEGGIRVRVGREDVEGRIQRFLDVYPRTVADQVNQVAAIDLRYTNGFAIKPRVAATETGDETNANASRDGA